MASTQPRSAPRSPPVSNSFSSSPPLPKQQTQSYQPMFPEAFANPAANSSHFYSNSQSGPRYSVDRTLSSFQSNQESDCASFASDGQPNSLPTVLIRNLPLSMSPEALSSMFLFADDYVEARFATPGSSEESGFQTALARFGSIESAQEVRKKLNGRLNSTQDAHMVVELLHPQPGYDPFHEPARKTSSGGSSTGSGTRQSSRFNSAFKSMDTRSPPSLPKGLSSNSDNSNPESGSQMHHLFSPQSPVSSGFADRPRISGKSVINDDADDETGELLRDPVAYARSGHMAIPNQQQSNTSATVSRLAQLSLNTSNPGSMSPPGGAYGNARNLPPLHTPATEMSPSGYGNGMPASPTSGLPMSPQHFQRHHYPPANPADQNPPCNTLYVGNLPIDTSEDELKALFSKQRGYKRLCFRTKHNGPMCFVEFEDVSFATKALNELYGHPLHNSVKGGIRLSFSKNPLGVRTGQTNSMGGPQSPLSPNGVPGLGLGASPGFSTANGPPPGLVAPPGLSPPLSMNAMNSTKVPGASFYGQSSPPSMGSTLHSRGSFGGSYSNGAPNSAGAIGSSFSGSIPGR